MKIIVDHIYGPMIKRLVDHGWRIFDDSEAFTDIKDRAAHRRICGCEMLKEFESVGDSIRDFEKITGYDVISDTDQCGCPVWTFKCIEGQFCDAGWSLGRYVYDKWFTTPRECLEELNK